MGKRTRPLAECYDLIQVRAIRLVRLHVAGRDRMSWEAARTNQVQRDRALNSLIDAVEERDRAAMAHEKRMEQWRKRSAAAMRAVSTRRRNARRAKEQ